MDAWYDGRWNQLASVGLSLSTGCATISVAPGYQWRMRVYEYRKPSIYTGSSVYFSQVAVDVARYELGTARLSSIWVG